MKVSELEGAELDYYVAKAEGRQREHDIYECEDDFYSYCKICIDNNRDWKLRDRECTADPDYSTNWNQGGPIIEREKIRFGYSPHSIANGTWTARISDYGPDDNSWHEDGPTPLIAAMRAYVASKFGDEVDERRAS